MKFCMVNNVCYVKNKINNRLIQLFNDFLKLNSGEIFACRHEVNLYLKMETRLLIAWLSAKSLGCLGLVRGASMLNYYFFLR